MILFLVLLMTLSACSEPNNYLLDEKFATEEFLPDYDMDSELRQWQGLCEQNDVLYFRVDEWLFYYDKASGQIAKLCGKPECTHDTASCNARHFGTVGGCVYDGYLYFAEMASTGYSILSRIDLDGKRKEVVQTLPDLYGYNAQLHIHRGYVYTSVERTEVTDGVPSTHFVLYQDVLGGKEDQRKVIYENSFASLMEQYKLIGNKLFLVMDQWDRDRTGRRVLSSYDVVTGEMRQLWNANAEWPLYLNSFYVDQKEYRLIGMSWNDDETEYTVRTSQFDLESKKMTDKVKTIYDGHRMGGITKDYVIVFESYPKTPEGKYQIMDHEGNLIDEGVMSINIDAAESDQVDYVCDYWGQSGDQLLFCWTIQINDHEKYPTIRKLFAWTEAEGMQYIGEAVNTEH